MRTRLGSVYGRSLRVLIYYPDNLIGSGSNSGFKHPNTNDRIQISEVIHPDLEVQIWIHPDPQTCLARYIRLVQTIYHLIGSNKKTNNVIKPDTLLLGGNRPNSGCIHQSWETARGHLSLGLQRRTSKSGVAAPHI